MKHLNDPKAEMETNRKVTFLEYAQRASVSEAAGQLKEAREYWMFALQHAHKEENKNWCWCRAALCNAQMPKAQRDRIRFPVVKGSL